MSIFSDSKRGRKTNGGRSHTTDRRVPKVVPKWKQMEQEEWRLLSLESRLINESFTANNSRELQKLASSSFVGVANLAVVLSSKYSYVLDRIRRELNERAEEALTAMEKMKMPTSTASIVIEQKVRSKPQGRQFQRSHEHKKSSR